MAYADLSFNGGQVRYFDLATGVDAAVPAVGPGEDLFPDVSGTTIVYMHRSPTGQRAIYSFDVASGGPPTEVDPRANSNRIFPAIGGATVAWSDYLDRGVPEIVAYDRTTGAATRLTDDTAFDRDPGVSPSGTVIVWSKCQYVASGCDIWQATLTGGTWTTLQLTNASENFTAPDTNGATVVYGAVHSGGSDLHWRPVGGGPEGRLALPLQGSIDPRISGNLVTFERFQADAQYPNFDIYAYDLSTDVFYRLTDTPEDDFLADLWSGPDGTVNVVWDRRRVWDG